MVQTLDALKKLFFTFFLSLLWGLGVISPHASAGEPWLDGWKKHSSNPVLSLSAPGTAFDSHNMLSPSVVKSDGTYYMYYSGGPSGPLSGEAYINYQLGLATSTDGINFTKHGSPLLALGTEDNFHVTPTLLRDEQGELLRDPDGTWHMVYVGNRDDDIEHATSPDGINWQKDPKGTIYENAYSPSVQKVGDEYWMYYIHKPVSGAPWEVHLAKGPDLYSLEPIAENPVLKKSQSWERDTLFYPYVFKDDDTWVMHYAGYWNSGSSPTKTAIGAATSIDGINWTKSSDNPILTPTPGSSYDSVYVSSQSILRDGDEYKMYYAGRVNSIHKYFSIGLATRPVGHEALKAIVHPATGEIILRNDSETPTQFDNYWIESELGALRVSDGTWNSLDDQGHDSTGSGVGQSWNESGGSDAFALSESFLTGSTTLAPGESISIGMAYNPANPDLDLRLKFHDLNYGSDYTITGIVEFVLLGDMDASGELNALDIPLFVQAIVDRAGFELASPGVEANTIGDFNGDGRLDLGDLKGFKAAFASQPSASSNATTIPEPMPEVLLGLACVSSLMIRGWPTCVFHFLGGHRYP